MSHNEARAQSALQKATKLVSDTQLLVDAGTPSYDEQLAATTNKAHELIKGSGK